MPLQATSGAASYDAFGGGVPVVPNYIEEVFSTYLYTGNDSTQTITNGIDLSTKGGLVWMKSRSAARNNTLCDTARGRQYYLVSNDTIAQEGPSSSIQDLTTFNSNGFSLGANGYVEINNNGDSFVSWTFRKQPKFFDVVTYTGNGSTQNIAHNLGSVPGCIIVKEVSAAGNDWQVYHRATTNVCGRLFLNLTNAENANGRANTWGNNTNPVPPTSTVFTVGNTGSVNNNGATFVAYLFAHDAGGFGLTGTDNVISCDSFTADGYNVTVSLGYEPQWLLFKRADGVGDWKMRDNMRGFFVSSPSRGLIANGSNAESAEGDMSLTNTGFTTAGSGGLAFDAKYIYIAIRRGPMKVPTSGTSVFSPTLVTGNGTNDRQITGVGFPPDLLIGKTRSSVQQPIWYDKLRGKGRWLESNNTLAEQSLGGGNEGLMLQDGFTVDNNYGSLNSSGTTYIDWVMRRAPSFFDEVCYTGTGGGATRQLTHNLGVTPELMIVKWRTGDAGEYWYVWTTGFTTSEILVLQSTAAKQAAGIWGTLPTSTNFYVQGGGVNTSAATYVAYLFATCAGVSKCTSFTGTGTLQTIDCGFTAGSRFVLIKRTDSTGDWYVWDSSRGLSSSTDPYLLLNSTAAEVTSTNWVDTTSTGFQVTAASGNNVNINGASYIALAIA